VPKLLKNPPSSVEESREHVPDVVLHIGLAPGRTFYTLEVQSAKGPYNKFKDVDGQIFSEEEAAKAFGEDTPLHLTSTLDCEDVWRRWNKGFENESPATRPDLRTGSADSVGLYLCGFVYYYTLAWFWQRNAKANQADTGERPVVFLHVPDLPGDEKLQQGVDVCIGLIRSMAMSHVGEKGEESTEPVRIVKAKDLELAQATQEEGRTYRNVRIEV
jgi:pyroglutamyl-peptidase